MIDKTRGLFQSAWKNPLRHHMGFNTLPGARLQITQAAQALLADFTTTNVGAPQIVTQTTIYMTTANICIFAFGSGCFRHTAAGALLDIEIRLGVDDAPSNEYVMASLPNIYVPVANENMPFHLSNGLNVRINLPLVVRPGIRRLTLVVRNQTAGTVTFEARGNVAPVIHGFVAGDSK